MSQHLHTTRTAGCYRCDLSAEDQVISEVHDAIVPHLDRLASEAPALRLLALPHGYVLTRRQEVQP